MAFFFAVESLKFYKMRNQRFVMFFFTIVFLALFGLLSIPVGDSNFDALLLLMRDILEGRAKGLPAELPLTRGNWIFLGYYALIILLMDYLRYVFAGAFVSESMNKGTIEGMKRMLKRAPSAIFYLLINGVVMALSSFAMLLPFLWFTTGTIFVPLLRSEEDERFWPSFKSSFEYTRGNKLMIFSSLFVLNFFIRMIQRLIFDLAPLNPLSMRLVSAFTLTVTMLVMGRYTGLAYLYFTKVMPRMAQSFGYQDPRRMMHDIDEQKPPHPQDPPHPGVTRLPYPHDSLDESDEPYDADDADDYEEDDGRLFPRLRFPQDDEDDEDDDSDWDDEPDEPEAREPRRPLSYEEQMELRQRNRERREREAQEAMAEAQRKWEAQKREEEARAGKGGASDDSARDSETRNSGTQDDDQNGEEN